MTTFNEAFTELKEFYSRLDLRHQMLGAEGKLEYLRVSVTDKDGNSLGAFWSPTVAILPFVRQGIKAFLLAREICNDEGAFNADLHKPAHDAAMREEGKESQE